MFGILLFVTLLETTQVFNVLKNLCNSYDYTTMHDKWDNEIISLTYKIIDE